MFKKISKTYFPLLLLLFLAFSFQRCKTTRSLAKEAIEPSAPTEATIFIAEELNFEEPLIETTEDTDSSVVQIPSDENYKYIFFRLYNPAYTNPFYVANMLKNGLKLVKTEQVPDLSHSAINFDLNDHYYGLTLGGEHQLASEECAVPKENKYMRHCNAEKSEQITYALKVTEKEYENTKEFVEFYLDSTDVRYASILNFKLAAFFLKNKLFVSKKYKKFGNHKYPKKAKNQKVDLTNDEEVLNDIVCSTFLGYVLYNNVESIAKYFDEHDIKYDYLNVTDLSLIPGMTPLFYSSWADYPEAAAAFVEKYPEFKEYLNN